MVRFSTKIMKKSINLEEKNGMWKGDRVGLTQLHVWVRRRLVKPEKCSNCGKKGWLDLANISQEYKRDLLDWEWLCRACHMRKDGRMKKMIAWNKSLKIQIDIKELKRLRKSGMTQQELGDRFGVSQSVIWRSLNTII